MLGSGVRLPSDEFVRCVLLRLMMIFFFTTVLVNRLLLRPPSVCIRVGFSLIVSVSVLGSVRGNGAKQAYENP